MLAVQKLLDRCGHHQLWDSTEEGRTRSRDALTEVKVLSHVAIALVLGRLAACGAGPARLRRRDASDCHEVLGLEPGQPPNGDIDYEARCHPERLPRDGLELCFHRANEAASDAPLNSTGPCQMCRDTVTVLVLSGSIL